MRSGSINLWDKATNLKGQNFIPNNGGPPQKGSTVHFLHMHSIHKQSHTHVVKPLLSGRLGIRGSL